MAIQKQTDSICNYLLLCPYRIAAPPTHKQMAWSKPYQLFPEPFVFIHLYAYSKKKKKDFQQALNRNSPRRNEHGCDARISAHGNPNCPPSLLAQLNGRCLALCSSGLLDIFWSTMWLFSRLERNGLFQPSCRHSSFSMSASLRGSFPPHFPLRRAGGGVLLRSPAVRHSLSL